MRRQTNDFGCRSAKIIVDSAANVHPMTPYMDSWSLHKGNYMGVTVVPPTFDLQYNLFSMQKWLT